MQLLLLSVKIELEITAARCAAQKKYAYKIIMLSLELVFIPIWFRNRLQTGRNDLSNFHNRNYTADIMVEIC